MITLAERLAQINAQAKAINDRHDGSWSSGLVSDLNHWADRGVYTADDLECYLEAEYQADQY